jgi:hypothetical protein
MPYVEIGSQPVFLSHSRHERLRDEVLGEKGALSRVSSAIHGSKESQEAQLLMINALEAKYAESPTRFWNEWVHFDMEWDEARENVWDLLCDYCDYSGYGRLKDFREPFERLIEDREYGDAHTHPMGRIFSLEHYVRPGRWWWRYTHKMGGRTVRIIIISNTVTRLVGTLSGFTIVTPSLQINCGDDFDILPIPFPQ